MADEGGDEVVPRLRLGMRGIAVPPEDLVFGGLQRLRREAELDEGLDSLGEQVVVKLVDAGPVVGHMPVRPLLHRAERIVKDGVEADVAKAEFVDGDLELTLSVVATHRTGIIGADRQIEEMVERLRRPGDVHGDLPRALRTGGR